MPHTAAAPQPLCVLGAGAWGTVVATLLARNGHTVRLWAHRAEHAAELREQRVNQRYLPELELPAAIEVVSDLRAAVAGAATAFVAVPSQAIRGLLQQLVALPKPAALISCSKGLEPGTFKRLTQVMADHLPTVPLAVLSGPNLAAEIASGLPAATTVASSDPQLARRAQQLLQQSTFRVYTSSDVVGVEAGAALKNVIALASGISDGLGLGDNTRATLITRGLAELVRLGTALGGDARTFYGLAGVGDLVATCSSPRSRNHQAGVMLARGASRDDLAASGLTAEGVPTAKAVHDRNVATHIELPISREVYRVVFEGKDPRRGIVDLMTRSEKAE